MFLVDIVFWKGNNGSRVVMAVITISVVYWMS